MKLLLTIFLFLFTVNSFANYSITGFIKDKQTSEPVIGASINIIELKKGTLTDRNGKFTFKEIPLGSFKLKISSIGYEVFEQIVSNNINDTTFVIPDIFLESKEIKTEDIRVEATRTNSRIEDSPIKVEVLGQEEVEEKVTEKPTNISMILLETAGIGSQITSANSGNVSIRIQGLDGKYTQLLKDGFPVYSGFFSGLSLMQVPPLDLKQIELIKGSSSSLYGSDAIAGIINLISKTPKTDAEFTVLGNINQKKGGDLGIFYSKKFDNFGFTFLSNNNLQEPIDINKDGFSDISKVRTFTLSPKFFVYLNENNILSLGINGTYDKRTGGDISVLETPSINEPKYFESNETRRLFYQFKFESKINEEDYFSFKHSISYFDRTTLIPNYIFDGSQVSSYNEISYLYSTNSHKLVSGINFTTENYSDNSGLNRNYNSFLFGLFIQDDCILNKNLSFQLGARLDYQKIYNLSFIPRASIKYNFDKNLFTRFSVGTGYKRPSLFDTESERLLYKNILQVADSTNPEKSFSINVDFNYSFILFDELLFSINQAFFYTNIKNPILLDSVRNTIFFNYENHSGNLTSIGSETNIRLSYEIFKLNLAYTFTNAKYDFINSNNTLPFSPKHRLVISALIEKEKNYKIGLESFYVGSQYIGNNETGRDYWLFGIMAEKTFDKISIILNCENITDFRQSKFEDIVSPPLNNPVFRPIYAPIDGIMLNLMVKYSL